MNLKFNNHHQPNHPHHKHLNHKQKQLT
ncbi:hypothetical protein NC653_001796 [Populus alba x Populus x berolinensis]|uniref:Uncharacterized protein n=1 Tax=Populus alba x Populus x berolinensis TaxID=444605 RepID=A0AAD6RNU3_9ROSI|nr:hypothetical protein NC653_001796 [Populus alba x Populus x berolinensis]